MRNALDPPWPALWTLALALDGAGVDWRLGGSALLSAMGLIDEVADLDVTVAAEVLTEVQLACAPWLVGTSIGDAPAPWCNDWLVSLRIGDTEVDLIGGLCVRVGAGRVRVPQDPGRPPQCRRGVGSARRSGGVVVGLPRLPAGHGGPTGNGRAGRAPERDRASTGAATYVVRYRRDAKTPREPGSGLRVRCTSADLGT